MFRYAWMAANVGSKWKFVRLDISCNILYVFRIQMFPRERFRVFPLHAMKALNNLVGNGPVLPVGGMWRLAWERKQFNTIGIQMKNKFTISLAEDGQQLLISEHAEVDKDIYSLLCEERFDRSEIETVAADDDEALVAALRTINLFPPLEYANQISGGVKNLLEDSAQVRVEVLVDDRVVMKEAEEALAAAAAAGDDADEDAEGLDHLLKEDAPIKPTMDATKEETSGTREDN
jgi:hypothetical protein